MHGYLVFLLGIAFVPMLLEMRRSVANEHRLRAAGAVEPAGDVYGVMAVVYPAGFLAMVGEAWIQGTGWGGTAMAGAVVFACAKSLKYWAIATLGERWTFRVLVPPHSSRTIRGPYTLMRHPNYLAVAAELVGFALLARAPIAGTLATVIFGSLMLMRIRVEDRALRAS